jgi:phage anti-repressor protein
MNNFLTQFSTLPKKFIDDFFMIAKENYSDNDIIINFDVVCDWLNTRKDHLKSILIKNFEKNFDYTETKKHKKQVNGPKVTITHEIFITPNCFKEICMISQTPKAKEVRKYFIEMERLIKTYHETIKNDMYKQIGILKNNQKPKLNITGGIIYIIKALDSDDSLYKIGKTGNIQNRIKGYNSGNANDIDPIFILKVDNIDGVENCIKNACKTHQYRKYKEIYQIDIDVLKEVITKCDELITFVEKKSGRKTKKELRQSIKEMKEKKHKYFAYVERK